MAKEDVCRMKGTVKGRRETDMDVGNVGNEEERCK